MSKNFIGNTPKSPRRGSLTSSFQRDRGLKPDDSEIKGDETLESHFPSGLWPMPNFEIKITIGYP